MSEAHDPRLDKLFIGYVRNSTEMQRGNYSEERQRIWCRETAIKRGYTNIDIREEQATSGQTIEGRPVFKDIIADIKKGKVGAFAAIEADRISRDDDLIDGLLFFQACKEHDVLIITNSMDFDPRNPIAIDMLAMSLMGSRHQNVANLKGLMRGLQQCAEDGHLFNGVLPFGYDRAVSTVSVGMGRRKSRSWFAVNEAEAKAVRLIHELIQLMGTQKVADKLNRLDHRFPVKSPGTQRILGKTERLWRGTDVLRIVRSPLYMGVKVWGGKRRKSKYLRDMKGPIEVRIPSLRIIDPAVWHATNALLDKRNPAVTAPRSANSPYLFSGPFRCVLCHGPMKGSRKRSGDKRYRVYECSNAMDLRTCTAGSISERVVAKAIRRHLVRVLANVGLDQVIDEAITMSLHPEEDELQRLDEKLAKLAGERTKELRLYLAGEVTDIEHKRERARITEEEERIKQQRAREELRSVERVTFEELRSYMGTDLLEWVRKLRGRQLSRVAKLVFGQFEVEATGTGHDRRGRLRKIRYSEDFARLLALRRPKQGENEPLRVPTRRLSTLSNH